MTETPVTDERAADEPTTEEAVAEAIVRRRRGRVVTAVAAAVVAAVLVVVGLLGGFTRRSDLVVAVPPGTVLSTGPYELAFTSATVTRKTEAHEWAIDLTGTARATGDKTVNPGVDGDDFVYAAVRGGEVQPAYTFNVGAVGDDQAVLVPGLPAVPLVVHFRMKTEPGPTVLVSVFQLTYTTPYVLSDEEGWRADKHSWTTTFPLQQRPDETY